MVKRLLLELSVFREMSDIPNVNFKLLFARNLQFFAFYHCNGSPKLSLLGHIVCVVGHLLSLQCWLWQMNHYYYGRHIMGYIYLFFESEVNTNGIMLFNFCILYVVSVYDLINMIVQYTTFSYISLVDWPIFCELVHALSREQHLLVVLPSTLCFL